MNQKLVQINNNYGIVSDENGNISFIEKENDYCNLEEILLKENNLEDLKFKLENCKNKLSLNEQNMIASNVGHIILASIEIVLFTTILPSAVPLRFSIALAAFSYITFKGMLLLLYGTRIGSRKKKKQLTADIEKMELEVSTLEKELAEIKEKSKYKVNVSTANEAKNYDEKNYPKMSLSMNSYIPEKHDTVKVLSLTKRRN